MKRSHPTGSLILAQLFEEQQMVATGMPLKDSPLDQLKFLSAWLWAPE